MFKHIFFSVLWYTSINVACVVLCPPFKENRMRSPQRVGEIVVRLPATRYAPLGKSLLDMVKIDSWYRATRASDQSSAVQIDGQPLP